MPSLLGVCCPEGAWELPWPGSLLRCFDFRLLQQAAFPLHASKASAGRRKFCATTLLECKPSPVATSGVRAQSSITVAADILADGAETSAATGCEAYQDVPDASKRSLPTDFGGLPPMS